MPGRRVGVVLAAYLSESRWLSVAIRALTRTATQNFCGQYLVRFSRPRETSCIAASVDGCSINTVCCPCSMQNRFVAGSVGQHVRERSGGLQSNSKATNRGVGELDAIVRGQENRSPPPQTLGLAGWPCAAAAITRVAWRRQITLPCCCWRFTHGNPPRWSYRHCCRVSRQKKSARYRRRCA